ncbi:MAG: glutathione peroxidase [Atopostipes suicloacalis]|nr:glutathione peroxidase [Atopostipes suicloacalis]MDN6731505.1 glutathione peroxidase [Atopostipes suicloacalis]
MNTATGCGLAPQFEDLENLYQKYKGQKFVILGFPSNQFQQEDTEDDDMVKTCKRNFGVSFPLNERVAVNGEDTAPIFKWLKEEQSGTGQAIKWNFTKFLIDREGQVVERYAPQTKPASFENRIKELL